MVRFFSDQKLFYGLYIIQRSVMLVFKYAMNVIGPLLHAIALLLIIGIVFVYYLVVFPNITRGSSPKYVFHLIVSTLLSINILFNLISCAFTSPGYAPPIKDPGKILGLELNPVNSNQAASYSLRKKCLLAPGVYYKYCKSCKAVKPPRAHHCSVTGRCVYEMDHYCPWMNNCVGLYNYKYFYLFLVHLFVGCLYFMITIGSEILTVTNKYERYYDNIFEAFSFDFLFFRIRKFGLDYPHEIVSLTFVVALGACISVGLLLLWHSYLVVTNQVNCCIDLIVYCISNRNI